MVAFDLDKIFQYSGGMNLLSDTLMEHQRLLWELEYLAKTTHQEGNSDIANRLNLVRAQILLFERLLIGERIDSLVVLVNHYAEILSQPRVDLRKSAPQ